MKKSVLIVFVLTCLFSFTARPQLNYVEIGSGSVSTSYPVYGSWNYGWYSAIYPQSALGGAKSILKIALYLTNGPKTFNNQKIYLKNSSLSVFADAGYENPTANGYTEVFSGNLTFQTGWNEITITSFAYNGTGNLILHWENRSGVSSYASFYSTTSTTNNNKGSGSDASFPTGSGYLNPYPSSLPNIRFFYDPGQSPSTPYNEFPANNSIRANVGGPLKITFGNNTTAYDLYLSTNQALVAAMDASVKVVADAPVTGPGEVSYFPNALLNSKTQYYWKVVAKNASLTTAGPVNTFLTQFVLSQFPYEQSFEDNEVFVTGWYGDMSKTDWTYAQTPINWNKSTQYNGHSGSGSAYISMYTSDSGAWSLMTPRINLPDSMMLTFWWKNNWPITSKTANYDTTFVQVTTNGGLTWSNIAILSPAAASAYAMQFCDLAPYAGNNVHFRWVYKKSTADAVPFFIDDIKLASNAAVPEILINPQVINYPPICIGGENSRYVVITNTGMANLVINGVQATGPFSCDVSITLAPGQQSSPVAITFTPSEATSYTGSITFNTNNADGNATVSLTGSGINPIGQFFQSFDVSMQMPSGWNAINSPWDQYSGVSIVQGTLDVYSAPYAAKILILNDSISPLMLVTPGLSNFNGNQLVFYAKDGSNYYDSIPLVVGVLKDPYNPATFIPYQSFFLGDEFTAYTVTMNDNTTHPYIAFRHGGNKKLTSLRIDDISWETGAPVPPSPAIVTKPGNNAIDIDIMTPVLLDWSNGGGNPTGYRIYFGTNNPPDNIINGTEVNADITSYVIQSELLFNTRYYWKIVPFNAVGDCPNPAVWSFVTMADPTIAEFPYFQDFNEVNNYPFQFDKPLGWTVEDVTNDHISWDALENPNDPTWIYSAPTAMNILFHPYYPKNDWLFTNPFVFQAGVEYTISFYIHTPVDPMTGGVYTEQIEVKLGNDNISTAMTSEVIAYAMVNQADYWVLVEGNFMVETTGSYYLGLHAISAANQYVLILDDVTVDEAAVNLPPVFVSTPVTEASVGIAYEYNIQANDPNGDALTFEAPVLPDWMGFDDNGNGTARIFGTPETTGQSNVVISVSDGVLDASQAFTILITGIGEQKNVFSISTYPNPCKNKMMVEFSQPCAEGYTIEITDLSGQIILKQYTTDQKKVINTGSLDPGIYILRVYSLGHIVISKIIRE